MIVGRASARAELQFRPGSIVKTGMPRRKTTLNIQAPEAHTLAEAIVSETGETITQAVVQALRERYERVRAARRPKAAAEEILAIARKVSGQLPKTHVDHAELLYDEHGLPK